MPRSIFAVVLCLGTFFAATNAIAQQALWQNSYQLEAAYKYAEAIAAIDAIPANGPEAELKLIRRGWLYYLAGGFNESIREYRLAMDRNPKSLDAKLGVTLPLLAAKRWREAEQTARAVLEVAPHNYTALLRIALAQEGQTDWTGMARTTSALTQTYPTDATAFVYAARAAAWLGKREDAVAHYTAVLVRYPGHAEAKAYIEKK